MSSSEGRFIVVEGGEGAGKSSLVNAIGKDPKRFGLGSSFYVRDPGTTSAGEMMRDILKSDVRVDPDAQCMLFTAARAQLWHELIRPTLMGGLDVVVDRWIVSTLAYQCVAGRCSLSPQLVLKVHDAIVSSRPIDHLIILDVEPEVGLARAGRRTDGGSIQRFEDKQLDYHRRVRAGLTADWSKTGLKALKRTRIDTTSMDQEAVYRRVAEVLSE